MRIISGYRSATLLALLCAVCNVAAAEDPLPGPHYFQCATWGDTVRLHWDALGIAPELAEVVLFRDDELLSQIDAKDLDHEADSTFLDRDVPPGVHVYRLSIEGPEGFRENLECEALVPEGIGLDCDVAADVVSIRWGPLPGADLGAFFRIDVRREDAPARIGVDDQEEVVAKLPPDARSYQEMPPPGDYRYMLFGIWNSLDPRPWLFIGSCTVTVGPGASFRRGDCNDDGEVDVADSVCILEWLFLDSEAPRCIASLNTNGDAEVDVADPVYSLWFSFLGGPAPVEPFPDCGPGTLATDGEMGCETSKNCPQ